jgi:hypothetical protein
MRRPNWKRQGLAKPMPDKDRHIAREKRILEMTIARLPVELRETARHNPHLIR